MQGFRSSLALSFAQRYSVAAIQLVSMVVIARLLSPAEIGIFAVAFTLVAFLHAFCESGIANYVIQERELTPDRTRTAFTLGLISCWFMALLLASAHGAIGRSLGDPRVGSAVLALSATFLVLPITIPVVALLRRRMAFGVLYVVGTVGALVSAATAILLAGLGVGFMALTWAAVAEAVVTAAAASLCRVSLPRGPLVGLREWRRVAAFGGQAAAASGLNGLGNLVANLATGRMLGFDAAGLLNRARRVVGLFSDGVLQAVTPVALPALAPLHHRDDGTSALKTAYLKKVAAISGTAWPFFLFVALTAHLLVPVLLGGQWDAAVPLVRALCLAGVVLPFHVADGAFMIALGRVRAYMWIQAAQQLVSVVTILIACLISVEAVALALAFGKLVKAALAKAVLGRELGFTAGELAAACRKSLGLTVASAVGPATLLLLWPEPGASVAGLAGAAAGSACGWLVGVLVVDHPLKREVEAGWKQVRA
jgi:O-antigen/teichoic acid export membrane protein